MNVFVSGASGFIGRHLVHHLVNRGESVRCLIHREDIPSPLDCDTVKGDITDYSSITSAVKGSDLLFHLAAALGSTSTRKETLFEINSLGTENLLKAAREEGVDRIIHFSSAGVLGRVPERERAPEDYPPRPQTHYDMSKYEGEQIARAMALDGMNVVIVRPGWVYGPADKRTFKLIQAISKRRFIRITRGETTHSPVYIDDLIRGVLLCAEKGRRGEIYHLAGGETLSVKAMVETIAEAVDRKIPRPWLPKIPAQATAWAADKVFPLLRKEAPLSREKLAFFLYPKALSIQKSEEELGFSPRVIFKQGMGRTISWYKEHDWL